MTAEQIFHKYFFNSKDKDVILKIMEEYSTQQNAEKDKEIERLKAELWTAQVFISELGLRSGEFKALVKKMRYKTFQKNSALYTSEIKRLETELFELESQVDKQLEP